MLIEEISEFQLRGPRPPHRTCTPTTGCFCDKTKMSKENFRVDIYYLQLKYCWRQCTLLPSTWAKSPTKFNTKMQNFKRVFDLLISRRRIEQFNFFNWFSNVKNLTLLNGTEHVRNVI